MLLMLLMMLLMTSREGNKNFTSILSGMWNILKIFENQERYLKYMDETPQISGYIQDMSTSFKQNGARSCCIVRLLIACKKKGAPEWNPSAWGWRDSIEFRLISDNEQPTLSWSCHLISSSIHWNTLWTWILQRLDLESFLEHDGKAPKSPFLKSKDAGFC